MAEHINTVKRTISHNVQKNS